MLPSLSMSLAQQSFLSYFAICCPYVVQNMQSLGALPLTPAEAIFYQKNLGATTAVQCTALEWLMYVGGEWYPKRGLGGMLFPLMNQQKRRRNGLAF